MTSNIPEILLLCMESEFITAFDEAIQTHWPDFTPDKVKITKFNARLNSLPPSVKFDLVVSPANSYGRLDGAFDHAISLAFSPRKDYHALTRAAQSVLYDKWRGYAPPGSCTLVEFPEDLKQNVRDCGWVAICPTMREPENVNWDREVVYECVWSLLCQLEGHNRRNVDNRIDTILMTPLATGIGKVSKERWAAQAVLALKHFVDSLEKPEEWSSLQWDTIEKIDDEVRQTWMPKE
jgi:O-acetyl-ADP-ribose deacetylase (regulator of RNase III)